MLCCRPPVAVPERLSLVHSPCAGLVSAGTADLVIRNIPMIDFVRPVGIMDAFLFIRSGLKRLFFLGYARHFPTSVALAAPGRDRLCLLQDRFRRGSRRFFQWVIVIAFCIRKAHQAKGQGQNHGQQDRDDFFMEKHFLSFGTLVSVSRRVLSSFIISYCHYFFNYHLVFCAHLHFLSLAPKSCLLWFLPHRGRGPTLHPGLSNFYQNAVMEGFRLIFPCF